jgi:hypothetical protein
VKPPATLAALLALSPVACTLEAGHGFATLVPGHLEARFAPGRARDLGEDAFLTDRGYRVHLETLTLNAAELELLELRASSGGGVVASFDPANPPAGYTHCHGGHCDADDGSLVSYEDVQARLAGGASGYEPIVTVPIDAELDLLRGERVRLREFLPSPELPRSTIARLEIEATRVRMQGRIEGGGLQEPVELVVDVPSGEPIARTLSLEIDRDGPEELVLDVTAQVDATVLDGVDLASLAADGTVLIDAESAAAEAITAWLVHTEIAFEP